MNTLIYIFAFAALITQATEKRVYKDLGAGSCADSTRALLPYYQIAGIASEACEQRCNDDLACVAYLYDSAAGVCVNNYLYSRFTTHLDWDSFDFSLWSTTLDGVHTTLSFNFQGNCMKKLRYVEVGQGACGDQNGALLPVAMNRAGLGEVSCIERCDSDDSCLGYRYQSNLCYNVFGKTPLTGSFVWDSVDNVRPSSDGDITITAVGNTGICHKKLQYDIVGGGGCATSQGEATPYVKIVGVDLGDCRARCDADDACVGIYWAGQVNACNNIFMPGNELTVYNDWDQVIGRDFTDVDGVLGTRGSSGICTKKTRAPTPSPTANPTLLPTANPTLMPTARPTMTPTESTDENCAPLARGTELKFTFTRTCDNGWSAVCMAGLALYDTAGMEIDLSALNPIITDTGYWRSGAHSYIGAEIQKDVGLIYCSEPLRCTDSDILDDEIVHIKLDSEIEFANFDLQQQDKLAYRPINWKLEVLSDVWTNVHEGPFDLTPREIRNFGNPCSCSVNGFWKPIMPGYDYTIGVTEGVVVNTPSHGPGFGTMNADGTVHWVWQWTAATHTGTISEDCSTITWENGKQWVQSNDDAVSITIAAKGWTRDEFERNSVAFTAILALEMNIPRSQLIVSLQNLGFARRSLVEGLSIHIQMMGDSATLERAKAKLNDQEALTAVLQEEFPEVEFDVQDVTAQAGSSATAHPHMVDSSSNSSEITLTVLVLVVLICLMIGGACGAGGLYACSSEKPSENAKFDIELGGKRLPGNDSSNSCGLYIEGVPQKTTAN